MEAVSITFSLSASRVEQNSRRRVLFFASLFSQTRTDSAVTRLVRWIVEAQALPLIAALFFLTSYAADSGGNIW